MRALPEVVSGKWKALSLQSFLYPVFGHESPFSPGSGISDIRAKNKLDVQFGVSVMRFLGLDRPAAIAAKERELAEERREQVVGIVFATLATAFNGDPLFPTEFSRLLSAGGSVVKKHGLLIEDDLAYALKRNHVRVERKQFLPISRKALRAVAKGRCRANGGRELPFNAADESRKVEIDILAIDEANGWACGISSKRGGGLTDSKKRKSHEREMRALDLDILDQLRARFPNLKRACVCIIDYLGQSGFSEDITLRKDQIDRFFGLSIVSVLDDTAERLRKAVRQTFGPLIEEAKRTFDAQAGEEGALNKRCATDMDGATLMSSDCKTTYVPSKAALNSRVCVSPREVSMTNKGVTRSVASPASQGTADQTSHL